MNRNKISGGIKFRELDYNKNSSSQQVVEPVRSKEEVLKLFANVDDDSAKENNAGEISVEERAIFESFDEIEEISEPIVSKEIVTNVVVAAKTPVKPKISEPVVSKEIVKNVVVAAKTPVKPKITEPVVGKGIFKNVVVAAKTPVKPKLNVIREKPNVQSNVNDSSAPKTDDVVNSDKRIYNVMVGKISTRKHKQWDSDGILEVSGKSAVLKDVNGKYIGRTTIKPETIEEGFRLCMGGKEIEIVELAPNQDIQAQQSSQESTSSQSIEPPSKKPKLSKGFVPVKSGTKKQ